MYLPIGVFGVSIATASLPDISRQAASADLRAVRDTVSRGLRMMLMLNVPATIGLMILAEPIVAMIYERGAFLPQDTYATAMALVFYAPGLIGYSAVKIASPTFYSLRDSRTPVAISVISILVNLLLNLALVQVLGYRGLALGTAIAALFNAGALLILLRRRLGGLDGRRLTVALLKVLAASVAMAAAAYFSSAWMTAMTPDGGEVARIARVFVTISIALAVLAAAARLLRIEEFDAVAARALKRFRR
jgi:putative peptidoglycan lipid II flippase